MASEPDDLSAWSVKQLKEELARLNANIAGCAEKRDLVELLREKRNDTQEEGAGPSTASSSMPE